MECLTEAAAGSCVSSCGPGRPARPVVWTLFLLLLGVSQPVLSGFSGPLWPHKESGKAPGGLPGGPGPGASRPWTSSSSSAPPAPAPAPAPAPTPSPTLPPPAAPGPEFDTSDIPTTVQARPGQTVFLPCRVKHRGDNVVLWMRTWPVIQVLTHGETVFASAPRFAVWHGGGGDAWTLKLTGVQAADSGRYECQVNTDPKMSLGIVLQVQEDFQDFPSDQQHIDAPSPTPDDGGAMIAGPRFVNKGTTVTFNCVADAPAPGEPAATAAVTVEWRYNGQVVSVQSNRGGISVETERDDEKIRSKLTVASVGPDDAGTYTCSPAGARPDSIQLIVVDGERTEAMHRGTGTATIASSMLAAAGVLVTFLYAKSLRSVGSTSR